MKNQPITSKYTSINKTKLPRLVSFIDWNQLKYDHLWGNGVFKRDADIINTNPLVVFDYGCGRYPENIQSYLSHLGIEYVGFDPYWFPDAYPENGKYGFANADVIICSNVLNVICNWTEVKRVSWLLRNQGKPYFLTVYEGDRSCVGQETKKDCWQWNKPTECYIMSHRDGIKKKVITKRDCLSYIK